MSLNQLAMSDQNTLSPYDELPVAIYTCDEMGFLTSYNMAAKQLWGRQPECGFEKWCGAWRAYNEDGNLVAPEDSPMASAVKTGRPVSGKEIIVQQPNGRKKNILVLAVPTFDEFNKLTGSVNTLVDITDQKKEETMRAMLASIVEYSDDAIVSKTLDGIITSWNQAAELMFGYAATAAIGKHISLIIPSDRLEEEAMIIGIIKDGGKVDHFETIRLTRDQMQIPISLTVSPIKNQYGEIRGASKVARDISLQKQAEAQLQHYASQLEHLVEQRTKSLRESVSALQLMKEELSQALEAEKGMGLLKSRFVSMASHEFRTPLSAITLSASLIGKYAESFEHVPIHKHVSKIKNAVGNLTCILNDFLSLEKLETGNVEPAFVQFDLVKFAEEITEEMQMGARRNQNIIFQHSGIFNMVNLDHNLLKNCIFNLISNAIKYSGEDSFIEFDTEINDVCCQIRVKDNGIGIPDDDQANLFSAFFRAHNTGNIPGTGLGLNIVARYVGLMGGKVNFSSHLGKGTCFTLTFPLNLI